MDKSAMELALPGGQLTASELELAKMIITTLDLDLLAEEISPTMPLFGGGLELDSIDVLEIALAISQQYGVKLRSDDPATEKIFGCLRSLDEHIQENRTR